MKYTTCKRKDVELPFDDSVQGSDLQTCLECPDMQQWILMLEYLKYITVEGKASIRCSLT